MKNNLYNILITCLLAVFALSCSKPERHLSFNHPEITYEGRISYRSDAAELAWSGTSVSVKFKGTGISVTMQDLDTANYYNVIIDNEVISVLKPDSLKKDYVLATGLTDTEHHLKLFKRTEWDKGKTLFYGFEIAEGGKVLNPDPAPERRIEFYGNSITCGYGNEDFEGKDRWFGYFQNNYETYAAITARHFNAQYHCISKSGIGILVSWFPLIMPEMYNRTDPTDASSLWDFGKYTPDVVVINLLQNDSWLVDRPEHDSFKLRFGTQAPDSSKIISSYKAFILSIRDKYPNTSIICALGSMDATKGGSQWPLYVSSVVNSLGDERVYTCFFPFQETKGHPLVKEHKAMAKQLISFIETNIDW